MFNKNFNQGKLSQNLRILLKLPNNSQHGLSMTEVLMAMLVTAIVLSIVSPIFLVATATRVLNFRAGQAMDLAQSEINRIQVNVSRGVNKNDNTGKVPATVSVSSLNDVPAPDGYVTNIEDLTSDKALTVDYDQDGKDDFLVQLFREPGIAFGQGILKDNLAVFKMGVRVYAIQAKESLDNSQTLNTATAAVNFGKGLEEVRTKPFVVVYTEVLKSNSQVSLGEYENSLTTPTTP